MLFGGVVVVLVVVGLRDKSFSSTHCPSVNPLYQIKRKKRTEIYLLLVRFSGSESDVLLIA